MFGMTERLDQQPPEDYYQRLKDGYGSFNEETGEWDFTRDQVIENVEQHGWSLSEGRGNNVCVRDSAGRIIRNSAAPVNLSSQSFNDLANEMKGILMTSVLEDQIYDEWLASLQVAMAKGDMRAAKIFSDVFMGRPPEISTHLAVSRETIEMKIAQALQPQRTVYVKE